MEESSNGSENRPETPKKGFLKFLVFIGNFLSAFFKKENNTAGTVIVIVVITAFLNAYFGHTFNSPEKDKDAKTSIVNDDHSSKIENNYNVHISTENKNMIASDSLSKKPVETASTKHTEVAKPTSIKKGAYKYVTVSSNLYKIDQLIERNINPITFKAKRNHIKIYFSPYPKDDLEYPPDSTVGELKPGAIIKADIVGVDCHIYIEDEPIQRVHEGVIVQFNQQLDAAMATVIKHNIKPFCKELKKCLQQHE